MQGRKECLQPWGIDPIGALASLAVHGHQTGLAQECQMARHTRLWQVESHGQITDGRFASTQRLHQAQARDVSESMQQLYERVH
jgi:hypothetical protein